MHLRPLRADDGPAVREVEWLAGEQFRAVGWASVADDEPMSLEELADYAAHGRGWVAVDGEDRPVGYVIVAEVDGNTHVEQMSVRPDRQRSGIGRALLDQVCSWALAGGRPAVTLTTFADVPWNRPVYERFGFRVIPDHALRRGLRAVRAAEADRGLDPASRVCMRLELDPRRS